MMRGATWLFALLVVAATSCAGGGHEIALGRPQTLRGLEGVPLSATAEVYREAQGCTGKTVTTETLDAQGDRFVGTLHLRPGAYFFCVRFRSGDTELGLYQDLALEVTLGADDTLKLLDTHFHYRDLDDDQDGIANLDEVRFNFDLNTPDTDSSTRVDLPAQPSFELGASDSAATVVEIPAHNIAIPAFAIDRLEVSVERYRLCVVRNQDPCAPPRGMDLFEFMNLNATARQLPATGVALEDARRFCQDVAGGDLPLEQQWEYAARPDGTVYPWGDQPPDAGQARCDWINARWPAGPSSYPCFGDSTPELVPVAHFDLTGDLRGCSRRPGSSAPDGPCQMAGNAWEWTRSDFVPYDGPAWPSPGALTVVRGGSADSLDHSLRSTFRVGVAPDLSGSEALAPLIGFRCVY
ncbi:MAG: SUMF1/EgtB/PvdO family nonheme iron enzyme [Pseudomonadota bacterium]